MSAQHFIDNAFATLGDPLTIDVVDPTCETVIDRAPKGSASTVARAVAAARAAGPVWAASDVGLRCRVLQQIADGLDARRGALRDVLRRELGMPVSECDAAQIDSAIEVLRDTASVLPAYAFEDRVRNSRVRRIPVGVVAAITPWNYPLLQVAGKLAPALAAGCTVVIKPSEVTPFSVDLLSATLGETELPPGVVNVVHGTGPETGHALITHPDVRKVSFTGSTEAGRTIAAAAAADIKRVSLELGGKSPMLVLPDTEIEPAVDVTVDSLMLNTGQTCSALTRLVVPRSRKAEAAARAARSMHAWTVGDPSDPTVRTGPLVNGAQYDRVQHYIETGRAEGARLVSGGVGRPDGRNEGYFVRPTVFADVDPKATIAQAEIFGPVLSVLDYPDADPEAGIAIANDSAFGLYAAVWGADAASADRAARRIVAGQVDVNGAPYNGLAPFGGLKHSGYGREMGPYAIDDYVALQAVQYPG